MYLNKNKNKVEVNFSLRERFHYPFNEKYKELVSTQWEACYTDTHGIC